MSKSRPPKGSEQRMFGISSSEAPRFSRNYQLIMFDILSSSGSRRLSTYPVAYPPAFRRRNQRLCRTSDAREPCILTSRTLRPLKWPLVVEIVSASVTPAIRVPSPFSLDRAMSIGPSENSPSSARFVRSRRYPPADFMKFDRSGMHAIATAAFSGPNASQAQRRQGDGGSSGEKWNVKRDDRQELDGTRSGAPVRDFGGSSKEAKLVQS